MRRRPAATTVPVTAGPRARAAARRAGGGAGVGAPAAVQGIIAAGNQIVGKPYLYGGGHGLPLDEVAPSYDCSSSVEHLLYGGRLLPDRVRRGIGLLRELGRRPARAGG